MLRKRRQAGEQVSTPLQDWLIRRDSAFPTRLPAAQVWDLGEGRGLPQRRSRPTFPDSLVFMALLSVASAAPATGSKPPPPPAGWPEEAVAATTWATGPREGGLPSGDGVLASPTSGGVSFLGSWRGVRPFTAAA